MTSRALDTDLRLFGTLTGFLAGFEGSPALPIFAKSSCTPRSHGGVGIAAQDDDAWANIAVAFLCSRCQRIHGVEGALSMSDRMHGARVR